MATFEGIALGIILASSIFSAIFTFFIWRSNVTRDIIDQESEISDRLLHQEFIISNPPWDPNLPDKIFINVFQVRCLESQNTNNRLRTFLFGPDGETHVYFQVYNNNHEFLDGEIYDDAIEHVNELFDGNDPRIFVSRRDPDHSQLTIESSRPEAVISEFSGFRGEFRYYIRGSYNEFRRSQ